MSEKQQEQWQVQELVDDAVGSNQITKEMINEYVYSFKQGGRDIEDLTASAYHIIALEQGINTTEIIREDRTDGVLYTVTVEKDGQERYGVAYQPFIFGKSFDNFCFQKALTKATRNAIKQFVNATQRFDVIAKLKALPMTAGKPQQAIEKPQPEPEKATETPPALPDNRIRTVEEMQAEPEPSGKGSRCISPALLLSLSTMSITRKTETVDCLNRFGRMSKSVSV